MTLQNTKRLVNHLCRLLKVNDVIIPIGRTSKGNFGIRFSANQEEYEMYLDAVPLSTKDQINDDNNIELQKMVDKYLFEDGIKAFSQSVIPTTITVSAAIPPKKRGRPAKNK